MIKKILIFLALFYCLNSFATTWYVRPVAGGPYGSDNGTSYANAWDGFAAVVWGVSGVNTGDTLKVCGSFVTADFDGGGLAMLSVDQSGVTIDGDCSADGGSTLATLTGDGSRDHGVYCETSTTCPSQTWKNISVTNFDTRGFYVRNSLSTSGVINWVGDNLTCTDMLGSSSTQCFSGFGDGGTLTDAYAARVQDDAFNWQGPNFTLDRWTAIYPGYQQSGNFGDCVQVVNAGDNAIIRNGYCDKTNLASKQCIIIGDPATGDNAEISDNVCITLETGNEAFANKTIYSVVPNTKILRNYVVGGYYGIYAVGASATIIGNVVNNAELRGIDLVSTVTSGTHLVANNTVSGSQSCIVANGGASVTTNAYNNIAANCSVNGFNKGGSSTLVQSNNLCGQSVTTCNNGFGGVSGINNADWVGGNTPTSATGFRLNGSSALRRAGLDLNLGNIQDKGNRAFAHPPSIGAWETASGDIASTRTNRD